MPVSHRTAASGCQNRWSAFDALHDLLQHRRADTVEEEGAVRETPQSGSEPSEVSGNEYQASPVLGFAFYLPSYLTGWIGKTSSGFFRGLAGVASYAVRFFLYLSVSESRRVDAVRRQRFIYTLVSTCACCAVPYFHIRSDHIPLLFEQVEKPHGGNQALWIIGVDPAHYPAPRAPDRWSGGRLAATALHATAADRCAAAADRVC
jgi:hypothetical protein